MEAGTVLIGVVCHALGITFVTLTACILLYLIIWGFLHWGDFLYRKIVRRRKIEELVKTCRRVYPDYEITHSGSELVFKKRRSSDELKAELDSFVYKGTRIFHRKDLGQDSLD